MTRFCHHIDLTFYKTLALFDTKFHVTNTVNKEIHFSLLTVYSVKRKQKLSIHCPLTPFNAQSLILVVYLLTTALKLILKK